MFWNKKEVKEDVESMHKLASRISLLEGQILDLTLQQTIIREKVLAKLKSKRMPEEDDKPKDIYNGVLLAS